MYSVRLDTERCKGCALCIKVCPMGVFALSDAVNARGFRDILIASPSECIGCLCCYLLCPDIAIEVDRVAEAAEPYVT